jgi:hypothetical protein
LNRIATIKDVPLLHVPEIKGRETFGISSTRMDTRFFVAHTVLFANDGANIRKRLQNNMGFV